MSGVAPVAGDGQMNGICQTSLLSCPGHFASLADSKYFDYFAYVPLLGAIVNLVLVLFVLGSDRRSRLNQVYFLWGMCVVIWNFGTFALFRVPETHPEEAYRWASFMQFGVIFIPVTMLHLCLLLAGKRPGRWLFLLYLFHVMLAVLNILGEFIKGVRYVGNYAWYSIAGPGFWIFTITFAQSFFSIILLWQHRKSLGARQQRRFNSILLAQTLLVLLGTNDILPILHIDEYPFTGATIRPYGSLAAVAYGVMVAYSVFQHQLLDVHLALGRSAAYIVRFLFLVFIAIVLDLCVITFAPEGAFPRYAQVASIVVLVIATLAASVLFPKLLGGAAEEIERRLLGDHFEYQDQVRSFTETARWHSDLPVLLNDLHNLLVNTLRVRGYSVILLDETNRAFTLTRAHPPAPQRQLTDLRSDSPIFRLFLEKKQPYVSLGTGYQPGVPLENEAREQLSQFAGNIAFPLVVEQQPVGLLILGEKISAEPYTRTDSQLLVDLTENLALVIHQISLKNQLALNQELDLLGRMSRGMAHDLNNLTTPVWTLLQLLAEDVPQEMLRTELVPVASRNIVTMRAYIKEALFFSENLRPDTQLGRLDVLLRTVVDQARENKRKGKAIRYQLEIVPEVLVEMDMVLIQRLLSNVLSNAIDASPQGSEIKVELIRLVKTDAARDWLRVRISDFGSGIKTEDLNRIFQPYFTTKKTGDEERGFGLGLAICRKIASLHGGHLTVQSEVGKGTIVNLDLPNRQKAAIPPLFSQPPVTPTPQPTSS
jgi:signal transduction histidine kinase